MYTEYQSGAIVWQIVFGSQIQYPLLCAIKVFNENETHDLMPGGLVSKVSRKKCHNRAERSLHVI